MYLKSDTAEYKIVVTKVRPGENNTLEELNFRNSIPLFRGTILFKFPAKVVGTINHQ